MSIKKSVHVNITTNGSQIPHSVLMFVINMDKQGIMMMKIIIVNARRITSGLMRIIAAS